MLTYNIDSNGENLIFVYLSKNKKNIFSKIKYYTVRIEVGEKTHILGET